MSIRFHPGRWLLAALLALCADDMARVDREILARMREAVGPDFIIIYRLSMIDLVPGGSTWDEVVLLAKAIERAGATIINTGIGWHEARIPTIATSVPRAIRRRIALSVVPASPAASATVTCGPRSSPVVAAMSASCRR